MPPIILLGLALTIPVFVFLAVDKGGINDLVFDCEILLSLFIFGLTLFLIEIFGWDFPLSPSEEVKDGSGVVGAAIEDAEDSLDVLDTLLLRCAVELPLSKMSDDLRDLSSIDLFALWEFIIPDWVSKLDAYIDDLRELGDGPFDDFGVLKVELDDNVESLGKYKLLRFDLTGDVARDGALDGVLDGALDLDGEAVRLGAMEFLRDGDTGRLGALEFLRVGDVGRLSAIEFLLEGDTGRLGALEFLRVGDVCRLGAMEFLRVGDTGLLWEGRDDINWLFLRDE